MMNDVIKFLFFLVLCTIMVLLGYWIYKKLNQRIIASETVLSLILYSLILVVSDMTLLFGGILILIKGYEFLRTLVFFGLIAVIPAYLFNRWLIAKIMPRLSFGRFLLFLFCILAIAFAYTMAISFILFQFVWPVK